MREGENERIFIRNAEVGLPDFFTNTELRIINKMKKKQIAIDRMPITATILAKLTQILRLLSDLKEVSTENPSKICRFLNCVQRHSIQQK